MSTTRSWLLINELSGSMTSEGVLVGKSVGKTLVLKDLAKRFTDKHVMLYVDARKHRQTVAAGLAN